MREILFRGKALIDNEWLIGAGVYKSEGYTWIITDDVTRTERRGTGSDAIISETVGQYTGLTDKNDKKIFEGDIVKTDKFNTPNKHYIIEYNLLLAAFIGEDDGTMYFTTFDGDSELFEVIGNIHDNPELLKGGG